MAAIRVLLVDDSVVVRRLLSDLLAEDPALEVVGTAAHGRIALAKLAQLSPDVIVLDVEMPVMGGLETLSAIRRERPRLPVIMFSSLTERGAAATLEALALGATDYVAKPAGPGGAELARERIKAELIPRIKALGGPRPSAGTPVVAPARGPSVPPGVVAIGVSTGGPNALAHLLPALPGDFPVPVVIVQHMPPVFTTLLAERLNAQCRLSVREATPGAELHPGSIWIAPGDHHALLERAGGSVVIRTHQGPMENSCRPAVDVLFRSLPAVYGPAVLALVLTGMGQDGLRGARAIREAGGTVLAQDQASSVVWGMPGYVAQAGLADRVLPLDRMAAEIGRRVAAPAVGLGA